MTANSDIFRQLARDYQTHCHWPQNTKTAILWNRTHTSIEAEAKAKKRCSFYEVTNCWGLRKTGHKRISIMAQIRKGWCMGKRRQMEASVIDLGQCARGGNAIKSNQIRRRFHLCCSADRRLLITVRLLLPPPPSASICCSVWQTGWNEWMNKWRNEWTSGPDRQFFFPHWEAGLGAPALSLASIGSFLVVQQSRCFLHSFGSILAGWPTCQCKCTNGSTKVHSLRWVRLCLSTLVQRLNRQWRLLQCANVAMPKLTHLHKQQSAEFKLQKLDSFSRQTVVLHSQVNLNC